MTKNESFIEEVRYFSGLYDFFNKKLFESVLSKPVITIQADEKRDSWFIAKEVWKENAEDQGATEISLSAYFLNRPLEEISASLIHAMCHQYAYIENLQDISHSGKYHNKIFKRIAETHGLIAECNRSSGWSVVTLTALTRGFLQEYKNFVPLYRVPGIKRTRVQVTNTRKYVCPSCHVSVKTTKQVNLMCLDCRKLMKEE